jgi:hypothetical protein
VYWLLRVGVLMCSEICVSMLVGVFNVSMSSVALTFNCRSIVRALVPPLWGMLYLLVSDVKLHGLS